MLYSFQPVCCQICSKIINISGDYGGRVCGKECWDEFNIRKANSLLGIEYKEGENQTQNMEQKVFDFIMSRGIMTGVTPADIENRFKGREQDARSAMERLIDNGELWVDNNLLIRPTSGNSGKKG